MKTLKLTLIAALVAATMVSLANTDGFTSKLKTSKIINCTFEKALSDPGLVAAMYAQLNPGFLKDEQPIYVVRVSYAGNTYAIRGTYEQWVHFFRVIPVKPVLGKKIHEKY
jgi:hypothetical protein